MSDLSKIATAEPIILTDGVSQQVAMTTTLPTASAVGLVVREVSQGQTTMANSHPVVLASDQAAVLIGGLAAMTNPTAVTNGQRTNIMTDKMGRQVVIGSHVRDLVVTADVGLATTTETTLLAAGGSGVFVDLTQLVITNDSATNVVVSIRDSTAGTVRASFYVGKNTNPSPIVLSLNPPWPQTTANNNWTVQTSAPAPTIHVFAVAVKNI